MEAIRALHTTRAGAVKARTAAMNELRSCWSPPRPRCATGGADSRPVAHLVQACARLRPTGDTADPQVAVRAALRALARRHQALTGEIADLDTQLRPLVERACPALIAIHGVGYETAAQLLITAGDNPDRIGSEAAFAALCGVAPIPASSGKTRRQRLSRGGDRQANRALHMVACTRLATCSRTRAYRDRRAREQLSPKDILRCLKRYLAREVYKALTRQNADKTELAAAA